MGGQGQQAQGQQGRQQGTQAEDSDTASATQKEDEKRRRQDGVIEVVLCYLFCGDIACHVLFILHVFCCARFQEISHLCHSVSEGGY